MPVQTRSQKKNQARKTATARARTRTKTSEPTGSRKKSSGRKQRRRRTKPSILSQIPAPASPRTKRLQRSHREVIVVSDDEKSSSPSPPPRAPKRKNLKKNRVERRTRDSSPRLTPKKRRLKQKDATVATPPKKKGKSRSRKKDQTDSPSKALANELAQLELDPDIDMSDPDEDTNMEIPDRATYIQTLHDRLLTNTEDFQLSCREEERKEISSFLETNLENRTCGSLYVCGSPGTGKTATINKILSNLRGHDRKKRIKTISTMNAMSLQKPNLIFPCLWKMISKESTTLEASLTNLENLFLRSSKSKMHVVILDEIDGLLGRSQAVLYRLFEWSHPIVHPESNLILIGIANSIDLTDRFLPKLKHRLCEPDLIIFEPYSADQLFNIVRTRLQGIRRQSESRIRSAMDTPPDVPLFDTRALKYIAGRVAKTSGDIRKCLEICRISIEEVLLNDPEKESIQFQDIIPVIRGMFSSRHVEILKNLPSHQCNVVVVASVLVKYRNKYRKLQADREAKRIEHENEDPNKAKSQLKKLRSKTQKPTITLSQLQKFYKYMAQKFNLSRVSVGEFRLIVDSLISEGLLSVANGGASVSRRTVSGSLAGIVDLNISVSFDDILFAMEDHDIWAKFFEDIDAENESSMFFIPESCRG